MQGELSKDKAEEIFREHSAYVYRVALFLTKSKMLADDITQETFLKVFAKYHKFNEDRPIKPWIYKVALNTTHNILRKHKWLHFVGEVPEITDLGDMENKFLVSEDAKKLWGEISKLTLKSREVIILHFYAGMKLKDIAEILNIPIGTCKSRLNQALRTLRVSLPKDEFVISNGGGSTYGVCETI